jgi:MFS family permease
MIDNKSNEIPKVTHLLKSGRFDFWGLSSNLWKVAFVSGISQFSISLWNWEFSIFLNEIMQPWQMGLVFSTCTFAGVLGYMISGTIADYMGRKWTMATALIPTFLGLITLSYTSIWPLLLVQFGLVWYGVSVSESCHVPFQLMR